MTRKKPTFYTDAPTEGWKDVPGWDGLYQAHPEGYIRRTRAGRSGPRPRARMSTIPDGRGYRVVDLLDNGYRQRRKVHHVILETFVGPRPPGMEGDHGDRDRTNNALSNLTWVTPKENCSNRGASFPRHHAA